MKGTAGGKERRGEGKKRQKKIERQHMKAKGSCCTMSLRVHLPMKISNSRED